MMRKILLVFGILFCVLTVLVLRPVPMVAEADAITEAGIVSYVFEGGVKDVVFRIDGTDRTFYINRGLENGLDIAELKEKLVGREVILKYPKYWTPLDWNDKIKHLSKVEMDGEVIFNEFKE